MSYLPCPDCKSTNVARESSIDGSTKCYDCFLSLKHADWDKRVAAAKPIRGGNLPKEIPTKKFISEERLVGCRRCRSTWKEQMLGLEGQEEARINSALYPYDFCSGCATEAEIEFLSDNDPEQLESAIKEFNERQGL